MTSRTQTKYQHEPCPCPHPVIDHATEYGGCRRCECKSPRRMASPSQPVPEPDRGPLTNYLTEKEPWNDHD